MAVEHAPVNTAEKVQQSRCEFIENIEEENDRQMDAQFVKCTERSKSDDSGDSEDSEDSEYDELVYTKESEEMNEIESKESIEEIESQLNDRIPSLGCPLDYGMEEKTDSIPEHPGKICQPISEKENAHQEISQEISKLMTPKPSKSCTLSLEKIDEDKELNANMVSPQPSSDLCLVSKATLPSSLTSSPTAEEVSRFINDKSAYIEDVFKCMLRGISDSKLSMVKNGFNAPSSITELEEVEEGSEGVIVNTESSARDIISPEVKIMKLIHNLDYFIDIICSIKSSDAKDTYSIILLYEKLIFDLKSEISSLSKSLMIYKTIVGKKQNMR